jgi:beta-lactamase superfamily II metal-dependent hydrolase
MSKPHSNNYIEFTLIGTGAGYGESIVLNIGNNAWIVVDSCIDPFNKKNLPLEYLKTSGVDLSCVKLIVCTHWHDDHIKGISTLFDECKNSKFCLAVAKDQRKFLQLVKLDYEKAKSFESISSTTELNKCLKIKEERNIPFTHVVQDKILYGTSENSLKSEVIALSPSDKIIEEYDYEISELLAKYGASNTKIYHTCPNDKSIVLLVKINDQRILLGSDLEVGSDEQKGWLGIIKNCSSLDDQKATIFKVPHHGSETSYHVRIWDKLIEENAISGLTPWNRGIKLPRKDMLTKLLSHTNELYITSIKSSNKPKKREKRIAKAIGSFNKTLYEAKFSLGIIKCSILLNEEKRWNIELLDNAKKIDTGILKNYQFK